MTDLEIRYPTNFDLLPFTTQISVNLGDNINALRDAILNLQYVLGLNINVGLFSPDASKATVAERLTRLERGIADRNLVFRELNVSDALQVLLTQDNKPFVRLGLPGFGNQPLAPVTIVGPLTILAPAVEKPLTLIQTPVAIDVTTVNPQASSFSLIKGKSNNTQPLLSIEDTNFKPKDDEFALNIKGNVKITGKLTTEFSIEHGKLLGTETVPTNSTRGIIKHVTQGDWHSHRKKVYDETNQRWTVDSSVNTEDYGIIRHNDLVGIGTLPTHGDEFIPTPGVNYHVTGGDTHDHKSGRGAQIDHNDLKNINPKFSNHVSGGDSHTHDPDMGDGGQISHLNLADIATVGEGALHVTGGDNHSHGLDEEGNLIGNGAQIDHKHLKNIETNKSDSIHITGGDSHSHDPEVGDGGQIDHTKLSNKGILTHDELETALSGLRTDLSIHTHSAVGGKISHNNLENIGTLSHDQIDEKFSDLQKQVSFTNNVTTSPSMGVYRENSETLSLNTQKNINFYAKSSSTEMSSIGSTTWLDDSDGYGAWVLGPSNSIGDTKHTLQAGSGNLTIELKSNSSSGTDGYVTLDLKAANSSSPKIKFSKGGIEKFNLYVDSSSDELRFGTSSSTMMKSSSSGSWTLGNTSSLTNKQTLYGEVDGYGTAITLSNSSFINSITHIKNTGTSTSLNNAATATFAFGTGASVFLMIANLASSNSALFFISNNFSALVSDPSNTFSNTLGTSNKTNIICASGTVTLQNNTGSVANYKLVAISIN